MLGVGIDAASASTARAYAFDARNSAIGTTRAASRTTSRSRCSAHYATVATRCCQPRTPPACRRCRRRRISLPDARSLFLGYHYSFAQAARRADARARRPTRASATSRREPLDFSDDLRARPRQRYVNRWRLEKKDPAARAVGAEASRSSSGSTARSRSSTARRSRAGILEWNKAFEKIGFKDAIRVKVQPDDADFDTLDIRHASVRWMTNATPTFGAIGPSHVDPRTGEILDADIGIESLTSRDMRNRALADPAGAHGLRSTRRAGAGRRERDAPTRSSARTTTMAAEQMAFALDVLEARGDLDPDSPEAEAFVEAYLKDVDDARGRPHARPAPQFPRIDASTRDAQLADPRVHARATASPAR